MCTEHLRSLTAAMGFKVLLPLVVGPSFQHRLLFVLDVLIQFTNEAYLQIVSVEGLFTFSKVAHLTLDLLLLC